MPNWAIIRAILLECSQCILSFCKSRLIDSKWITNWALELFVRRVSRVTLFDSSSSSTHRPTHALTHVALSFPTDKWKYDYCSLARRSTNVLFFINVSIQTPMDHWLLAVYIFLYGIIYTPKPTRSCCCVPVPVPIPSYKLHYRLIVRPVGPSRWVSESVYSYLDSVEQCRVELPHPPPSLLA